jgi:phage major head subunit gpT-like protein
MAGVMNTGTLSQVLSKDLEKWFMDEFSRHPEEWKTIANVQTMDSAYHREGEGVGLTAMQEMHEGQAVPMEQFEQGNTKTIQPRNWGLGVQFTRNAVEDDQQGVFKQGMQELGKAAAYTRDLEFFDILNSGFTTARVGLDGKELFADDHPVFGTGETNSNLFAGSLSKTVLEAMMDHFEEMKNDRGVPIIMKPKVLLIPPKLKWRMKELMLSPFDPETANNTVNTVHDEGLTYMVGHFLESDTAFFMLTEKQAHDLRFVWRRNLDFRTWDDPNTENVLSAASMRFVTEFYRWRGAVGSPGV